MTYKARREFLIRMVTEQRKWIESCESNGRSYSGPNGRNIRQADENALKKWEYELAHYQKG